MIKSTERQKLWLRQRETEVETSLLDIWLDVISGTVSALRLHKEDNFLDYCSRLSCNVTWLHLSSTLSCGKTDSSACLSSAIYHCKKIIPLYFSVCDVDKECRQGYDAGRAWSKKDCAVCGCMLTLQEHASAMEGLSGIEEEECSMLEWSSKPAFVCSNRISPHTTLQFMICMRILRRIVCCKMLKEQPSFES